MKRNSLIALAVIAAVLVLLGTFTAREQQATDTLSEIRQPVFPDLQSTLGDVQRVTLRAAKDEIILDAKRSGDQWVAENKGGYPVRTAKLRDLLAALAEASFQEAKTSNPEQYHHLGLRGLEHAESAAVLVSIERADKPTLTILLGKEAAAWKSTYARLTDAPQSWALDREIAVAKKTVDWLQLDVLDIDLPRVRSVSHRAPDGEQLWVEKQSPEQSLFDLANIPEGHTLTYEAVPEVVADVIDNLRLEDVVPAKDFTWDAKKTYEAEFRTFDGLIISSRAMERDAEQFVALSVRFDPAARWAPVVADTDESAGEGGEPSSAAADAEEVADASATEAGDVAAEDAADTDASAEADEPLTSEVEEQEGEHGLRPEADVRAEAEALQARLAPWVFRIPEYRFKGFIKRTNELVKKIVPAGDVEAGEAVEAGADAVPVQPPG